MAAEMSWEEKLAAIQSLTGDASLKMRRPGNWYVNARMDLGGNGLLEGKYGNGATPEEAVENHWKIYTMLPPDRYVVVNGNFDGNRRLRWNGYMWREVDA